MGKSYLKMKINLYNIQIFSSYRAGNTSLSVIKTNQLILYREIIAVSSEFNKNIHIKKTVLYNKGMIFSKLLVLALITSHQQNFFFIKSRPPKLILAPI